MKNSVRFWTFVCTSALSIGLLLGVMSLAENATREMNSYVKFQDRMSMDWDSEDERVLLEIADHFGGSIEDRAYNVLVTLNRMLDAEYPGTIPDVAAEVIEVDTEMDSFDAESREAIRKVVLDRWDETCGSLEYRERGDE